LASIRKVREGIDEEIFVGPLPHDTVPEEPDFVLRLPPPIGNDSFSRLIARRPPGKEAMDSLD
jgi:hypothetical protein